MKMKHVLLIDDNDIDNYISKAIITRSNIASKITLKSSAMDALKYLNSLKDMPEEFPDLIFLDIRMPQMDGFGFLDEYSKFSESIIKQSSVVMLTSSDDPKDKSRASQYPVVKKFLTKPLEPMMLENL